MLFCYRLSNFGAKRYSRPTILCLECPVWGLVRGLWRVSFPSLGVWRLPPENSWIFTCKSVHCGAFWCRLSNFGGEKVHNLGKRYTRTCIFCLGADYGGDLPATESMPLFSDDFLEDKREDCQNCSVLYFVPQLYAVISTHLIEQFLPVY